MAKATDRAIELIDDRRSQIINDLDWLSIDARPEFFEPPKKTVDHSSFRISVRTIRNDRLRIQLAPQARGLSDIVRFEIVEDYSFKKCFHGQSNTIDFIKYSYTISYKSELHIESHEISGDARDHWDSIYLAQRKFFRFDGTPEREDAETTSGRELEHRNQHPRHHFHPSTVRHLRFPVPCQPSILAVASFALIDFDHARWLAAARRHPEVLQQTQQLLGHVSLE